MNTCLSDELDRLTEAFNFTPDSIFVDNFVRNFNSHYFRSYFVKANFVFFVFDKVGLKIY